jgi:hypothetical protein
MLAMSANVTSISPLFSNAKLMVKLIQSIKNEKGLKYVHTEYCARLVDNPYDDQSTNELTQIGITFGHR